MNLRFTFLTTIFLAASQFVSGQSALISTDRNAPAGMFTFGSVAGSNALGAGRFVDGYVRRQGSGAFTFPVGDNNAYRPFAAAAAETSGAYFAADPGVAVTSNPLGGNYAALPSGAPFNTASLGTGVDAVSKKEYWDINGSGSTRITLTWTAASDMQNITTGRGLAKVTIVGWDGSRWIKIPSTVDATSLLGGASTITTGSITTDAALTPDSYNVYTLAATAEALPVTLASFEASKKEQSAYLQWVTAQEINSDHFDIERSGDGKIWNVIGSVQAKGSGDQISTWSGYDFTDLAPLPGANLYRLKMVDHDETFAYSHIASLQFDSDGELAIYPNPASDFLLVKGLPQAGFKLLTIADLNGRTLLSTAAMQSSGVNISRIPTGLYIVSVKLSDGTSKTFKLLIK